MPRVKKVLETQKSVSELNVPKDDNSPSPPPPKKTRKTKKTEKPLNESSTSSLEVKVTKKTDKQVVDKEDSPMAVNTKKKFNLNRVLETDDKEMKLKQITDKFISDLIELDINLSEANVKYIRKLK